MDRKCDALGFCLSISLIISVMTIPTILSHSLRLSLCEFKHCNIALNICLYNHLHYFNQNKNRVIQQNKRLFKKFNNKKSPLKTDFNIHPVLQKLHTYQVAMMKIYHSTNAKTNQGLRCICDEICKDYSKAPSSLFRKDDGVRTVSLMSSGHKPY